MQKDDIVVRVEETGTDQTYQACEPLALINRIKEQALQSRCQHYGFERGVRWNAVTFANISVVHHHRADRNVSAIQPTFPR